MAFPQPSYVHSVNYSTSQEDLSEKANIVADDFLNTSSKFFKFEKLCIIIQGKKILTLRTGHVHDDKGNLQHNNNNLCYIRIKVKHWNKQLAYLTKQFPTSSVWNPTERSNKNEEN